MEVFVDVISNTEYFSSALNPRPVKELGTIKRGDVELPIVVSVESKETIESLAGMGLPEGDDEDGGGGAEADEKKLDLFWAHPDIENDHTETLLAKGEYKGKSLTKHQNWVQFYFKPYCKALLKWNEANGTPYKDDDLKEALSKFSDWVKEHIKELQVFGPAEYMSGEEPTALAYCIYQEKCDFFFFRPGFNGTKF